MSKVSNNSEPNIDKDMSMSAGVTAGTAFYLMERQNGETPLSDLKASVEDCIKAACNLLSIQPNSKAHYIIHLITITFIADKSGLAKSIVDRYSSGEKGIFPDEVDKLWDLTYETFNNIENFSKVIK